jgi:segregation and condensation protein A
MDYALKIEHYEGPLEKLLELIEERKLDVSEISLATVTDDFLKYLEGLPEVAPALLADFLVVASRLVLIKSKALLPELVLTDEEEHDIKDLEHRLETYRRLKGAERHVMELWRSGHHAASRPYLFHAASLPPIFHPGSGLDAAVLAEAFRRIYTVLEKITLETATVRDTIVSLEEKMRDVLARMATLREINMIGLSPSRSRADIVVIFLAVLHLAREGRVILAQAEQFSDIIVTTSETPYGNGN